MNNLYVKIVTGFREDQHYTIPAEEAHKAFHLFKNPDERGIFNNGLAIIGQNIQAIIPDFQTTMGWNKGYQLQPIDYEDISAKGIDRKLRDVLSLAKELSNIRPDLIDIPLSKALETANLSLEGNGNIKKIGNLS